MKKIGFQREGLSPSTLVGLGRRDAYELASRAALSPPQPPRQSEASNKVFATRPAGTLFNHSEEYAETKARNEDAE